MENGRSKHSVLASDTDTLLEEWQNILEGAKDSLAKASELATRMESACKPPTSDEALLEIFQNVHCHAATADADGEYVLRRPTLLSEEGSNLMSDHAESFKSVTELPRERSSTKLGPILVSADVSHDTETAEPELDTSLDIFRRRKTVHEIPQLVIDTPEAADKFKRRRSTGEVPKTPRMQLSCVNSPGTPSAHLPRTPIPLAKNDPHTPDTHFHPPLFGGTNSCRKRELSSTENVQCPDTPPLNANAAAAFSSDDISSLFDKLKLEAPSRLTPSDDLKKWESDMNAAYFAAFKLIAAGMDQVRKESRKEFGPVVSSSSSAKSKSVMTSILDDVMTPLDFLMNHEIDDEVYATESLASIEKALLAINKQVPLEQTTAGCTEAPNFFNRRVVQKIETMSNFMRKANNKITDDMRKVHFLGVQQDFGDVAGHVTELLRSYNEAICQLDYLSSGSTIHKVSYDT